MRWRDRFRELIVAGVLVAAVSGGTTLATAGEAFEWGLHIVFFDVGQADAVAMVAADGSAAVIDAAHGSGGAGRIATFLEDEFENGVRRIDTVAVGFVTHYDQDHVGGIAAFEGRGIAFQGVMDQGPSLKRRGKTTYEEYLVFVGDPDDDAPNADADIRRRAEVGQTFALGGATIRVVGVRGDTEGSEHDLDLDPREESIDENPGSIALLVTLGDFELYTAGDQTSDDWKHEPDTEIAVIESAALGEETDVDVLKANHHGSDTSNGSDFIAALSPEVAIVSSKFTAGHQLPKRIALRQLTDRGARVYVTGDGTSPVTGRFADSGATPLDDDYEPPDSLMINAAGDVHILVSADGTRYRVFGGGIWCEYSAVDEEAGSPPVCE